MAEHRLFLLDGMALAYRAHFALIRNPITNSKGVNTSAVYGFANTLVSIIQNEMPTHLAVAFDTSAPTARHKRYPAYKAQREEMPEDLSAALPNIKKLCQAMKIPILELDGYEADDIIGTLSKQADQDGNFETFMVTPDKDFAQLVSETTSMWKPGRQGSDHEVLGLKEILEKWEITDPSQVIDILGLWGDASDNIPGVPGVGEKTAKKLVGLYGSVERLLANTDKLKGKQKEKVEANKEQALLSKELATIDTAVPIEMEVGDLLKTDPNAEELSLLFAEWEFRTLSKRLLGKEAAVTAEAKLEPEQPPKEQKTLAEVPHIYTLLDSDAKVTEFLATLSKVKRFCFDLETSGLNRLEADILGIAFCSEQGHAAYLPYQETYKEQLTALFANKAEKVGHNLKFDLAILHNHGISVSGTIIDTMLIHALIAPGQKHGMDALAESVLGYKTIKLADLATEAKESEDLFTLTAGPEQTSSKKNLDPTKIALPSLAEYACEDVDITWQLSEKFLPQLDEMGMHTLYFEVEAPLLQVLVEVEMTGIMISTESLKEIGEGLQTRIDELSESITKEAGQEFNLNSPKQMGEILFGELKLVEKPKKTKTGQFVTNEQILNSLAPKHKIVADILAYRECSKLKNTYVDALPNHIEEKTGRIHTNLHQLQTSTGRLASSDPNLQNIPVRSEAGRTIRAAFIPEGEDFTLLACDYSQIELRVMAAMSGDKDMIKAFKEDQDIHTATSAKVFGVDPSEVSREMRSVAKMVNFGIIYGISPFGLSQRLDISRKEASEIIKAYFEEYPGVKAFMTGTVDNAIESGYVETLLGRRRYMPDLRSGNKTIKNNAERAAINTPIQGSAADMIKVAMINVQNFLKEKGAKTQMLLQVHDELLFNLHKDEHDLIPSLVKLMESALILPEGVPAKVEYGLGENWLIAH